MVRPSEAPFIWCEFRYKDFNIPQSSLANCDLINYEVGDNMLWMGFNLNYNNATCVIGRLHVQFSV